MDTATYAHEHTCGESAEVQCAQTGRTAGATHLDSGMRLQHAQQEIELDLLARLDTCTVQLQPLDP